MYGCAHMLFRSVLIMSENKILGLPESSQPKLDLHAEGLNGLSDLLSSSVFQDNADLL